MNAPKEILTLIERFEQQLDDYKSGQYNETPNPIRTLERLQGTSPLHNAGRFPPASRQVAG